MKPKIINEIFQRLHDNTPDARIELYYTDPYTLLVAVILSAQALDTSVNKVTEELFKVAYSPETMLALGEEKLKTYVKSIGLYNTKVRNIIEMSRKIICDFGGKIPDTIEQLMDLPGVGRKSANVILNTIFHRAVIAVDTHVFRVANRLGLCVTKTPEKTEFALMDVVPQKWAQKAHNLLVLHGRYICRAKRPNCGKCILHDICLYEAKTTK